MARMNKDRFKQSQQQRGLWSKPQVARMNRDRFKQCEPDRVGNQHWLKDVVCGANHQWPEVLQGSLEFATKVCGTDL